MALFIYGTLCHDALRAIVLGPDRVPPVPARLPDHEVRWAADGPYPMIRPAAGALAEGLLLEGITQDDLARLDFYEGGFGYRTREVGVETGAGPARALVYLPPAEVSAAAPWSLEDWVRDHGALTLIAAREAMGEMGRITPQELAARFQMMRARAGSRLAARQAPARGLRQGATAEEVLTAGVETDHAGFFRFETHRLRHPRFGGGMSPEMAREVFVGVDAALVLPYDPLRDRVLLIEQFRIGPLRRGDALPWTLEPVAGLVDPGETPEDTARREAREEAGLEIARLEPVARFYPSPGATTEYFHCFVGLCDLTGQGGRLGGKPEEHEDILSHVLSFDAAMALLDSGEAEVGPLVVLLLWLARHRDRLRQLA